MNYSAKEITSLLTNREMQILNLMSQGDRRNEIAEKLFISPLTYDCHRKSIKSKLRIRNQMHWAQLIYSISELQSAEVSG